MLLHWYMHMDVLVLCHLRLESFVVVVSFLLYIERALSIISFIFF